MKKIVIAVCFFGLCGSVMAQGVLPKGGQYVWGGRGTILGATTNAQVYTLPQTNFAYSMSLHVEGTNKVFFGYGNTIAGFNPAQAEPVSGGAAYNSDAQYNMLIGRKITSIIYQTTNGTSLINVSFE